jgi:WD40 repeat protein
MNGTKDDRARKRVGDGRQSILFLAAMAGRVWSVLGRLAGATVLILFGAALLMGNLREPAKEQRPPIDRTEPTNLVEAVAFSPDGRTIASCSGDFSVWLWDVSHDDASESPQPIYLHHDSPRVALAFSADGRYFVSAGEGSVAVWSCQAGVFEPLIERTGPTARCLAFSPDSKTLALGGDDGVIRLWDTRGWRERAVLRTHTDAVRSVAFSPDGRRLVSCGQDRRVMVWDAIRGAAIRQIGHAGPCPAQLADYSPDGKTIAIAQLGSAPSEVELVDPETGAVRTKLGEQEGAILAMAFSPHGSMLATAGDDGCITLWNLGDSNRRRTICEGAGPVKALAFSPEGTGLAFADVGANLRLIGLTPNGARLFNRVLTKTAPRPGSSSPRPIAS